MTVTESESLKKGSRVYAHIGHPVSPNILKTPYSLPFRAITQARKSASNYSRLFPGLQSEFGAGKIGKHS